MLVFPPVYRSGAPSTSTQLRQTKDHNRDNDKETLLALFNRYTAKTRRRFTIT